MALCLGCALIPSAGLAQMQALWVATVINIDWPSKAGLDQATQKAEFQALLDKAQSAGINTLFVQVRAAGDAIYPSRFAPWARSLTGTEGEAPDYDPLAFLIEASHQRGMSFHAWVNPYRASMNLKRESHAPSHDLNRHPDWMIQYGKKIYYDPGRKAVREHLLRIIDELLTRYSLDGIHFDDYFYPYRLAGEVFDDQRSYAANATPGMAVEDWRRENTARFVYEVKQLVQHRRPKALFGVSPFGVWRNQDRDPAGSDTAASQSSYDDLYADVRFWGQKGWVDYLAPQLYWHIGQKNVDYAHLANWWAANTGRASLVIGLAGYKVAEAKSGAWRDRQLLQQIDLGRRAGSHGFAVFSAKSLDNRSVHSQLQDRFNSK